MKNPAVYCNRCCGIIDDPLRSCYVCLVCAKRQECSNIELYALLNTILDRAESPVYREFEFNFPTISTQSDIIRRMQRTLNDIAADIHHVLDRKTYD
jgi:hypothetical protein